MNDYYRGIIYSTGYLAVSDKEKFVVVRNLDEWYVKCIENVSKYKSYKSMHNIDRDGEPQWCIKARDINTFPQLSDVVNDNDFCRAYIEIHGTIDLRKSKNRQGQLLLKPRLRIYGNEEVVNYLNNVLPAEKKKIQYVKTCSGSTYALYYQSLSEILAVIQWIDGDLKNVKVWGKWSKILY